MLPATAAARTQRKGRSPRPARKNPNSMSVSPGSGGKRYSPIPANATRVTPTMGSPRWKRRMRESMGNPSNPFDEVPQEGDPPSLPLEGLQDAGHHQGQDPEPGSEEEQQEEEPQDPVKVPEDDVHQNHGEQGDQGNSEEQKSLPRMPDDEVLPGGQKRNQRQDPQVGEDQQNSVLIIEGQLGLGGGKLVLFLQEFRGGGRRRRTLRSVVIFVRRFVAAPVIHHRPL